MSRLLLAPPSRRSRGERGVTMIEAIVALLVMSFGMLALVGLMSNLRRGSDLAKQRSEAMRIARAEIASLRAYSELAARPGTPASAVLYSQITNETTPRTVTPADSNTSYEVQRQVTDLQATTGAQARSVRIAVTWTDRAGDPQFVNLDTVIAAVDPVFSAAVGLTRPVGPVTQPGGRHPAIPPGAKKLNNDISAFRPSSLGSTVWVFNNLSGVITGKCSIPAGTPVSTLTEVDVDSCKNNTVGYLLSGNIRFSNTDPANPRVPEAMAIPLGLDLVSGSYVLPRLLNGAPVRDSNGNLVLDSFTATLPTRPTECFNDSPGSAPSTQPFVTYHCIVYPDSATPRPVWSGKLVLTGFSTGTTAADYRVCRYSADYNGNGGPYTADLAGLENEEHPAVYAKVARSLARQNFLVVRGDRNCPTAPAVDFNAGVFANYSTVQLQP